MMIDEILEKHCADFFIQHSDINLYYATRFKALNCVFYIVGRKGDFLIVPDMEKNRALRESRVKNVISLGDLGYHERRKSVKDSRKAIAEVLADFLRNKGAKKIVVPTDFPAFLTVRFIEEFRVEVIENPFLKIRAVKSPEEVEMIRDVSTAVIDAFNFSLDIIKKGEKNCDYIRDEIEKFLFLKGYLAENTIVSSGEVSSDPHSSGGTVEDHVLIDIFPKSRKHSYYSDFTRTVIVRKNMEIEEMLEAVIEAQESAISIIRDGVTARDVHYKVCDVLESYGYKTIRQKADEGFIHSTGHGIGLELHEEPRIFDNDEVLRSGMVFTVEPGLYYRKVGGVRVEDVVVVKRDGCEVLTRYPKRIYLKV